MVLVEEEACKKEEEENGEEKDGGGEEEKEEEKEEEVKTEAVMEEVKPKKKGKLLTILLIVLVILAIGGGVFLFTKVRGGKKSGAESTPTPAPEIAQEPTPISEPELERGDLTIQVQNGTGEPGAAGDGKDFLEELGYEKVETGNAPSYNYKESEISLKEEKSDYFDLLYADLNTEYLVSSESSVLEEDSDYDAVIVLGKKAPVEEEVATE